MSAKDVVVLLGRASAEDVLAVRAAAVMAGAEAVHESSVDDVAEWLNDEQTRVIAVVMSLSAPRAARAAVRLRGRYPTLALPLIGFSSDVHDLVFEEAFASGFDDVCGRDSRQLGRRLRNVAEVGTQTVKRSDEKVVVADADRQNRLLIGRVFRDAGYAVGFAGERDEVIAQAADPAVRVVICSADLELHADGLLSRKARNDSSPAWIVNTPPKQMIDVHARLAGADARVAVHDAFACPATLLFVANELVNRPAIEGRKTERLLYGTTLRFRGAGQSEDEVGYLYNISGGGLYVRTLAPPSRWDELWVEFTPPRCGRRVHLEGTSVWARRYGPASGATVPCGFGLEITGASRTDSLLYQRSYQTFLDERIMQREEHSQIPSVTPMVAT